MKIAIVCGHFIPELGYIEVHLARAFAELQHGVKVFTTDRIPNYTKSLTAKPGGMSGIEIQRFQPKFSLGQMVVAFGLRKAVTSYQPELVIIIGLGKLFPWPILDIPFPKLILLGDNAHSYRKDHLLANLKNRLLLACLKKPIYRKALRSDAKMVAYTPESFEAAAKLFNLRETGRLRKENRFISLGFWPDQFYFDAPKRTLLRQKFGLTDDQRIIITATRVVPEKELEKVLDWMARLPRKYAWWLVGVDQTDYALQFANKARSTLGDRFQAFAFQSKAELNGFYAAADLALYTVPAISIFEAMGTGLPAILPDLPSLSHILTSQNDGAYYQTLPNLEILDFNTEGREAQAATFAQRFGWKAQAEDLLKL